MAEITFLDGIQGNKEWVTFFATVDGKLTTCKILLEALANRFRTPELNVPELSNAPGL